MKVDVEIYESEVENEDLGGTADGLVLTCDRCGHVVEVMGTTGASARYGAVKLKEECPNGENNFYEIDWE